MSDTPNPSHITRITQLFVGKPGDAMYAERTFTVSIDDEGAGEYISVEQPEGTGKLCIDPEEWPALRDAIDRMMPECTKRLQTP